MAAATQPNLDQTLIALADPTRRAILQRLSCGEARVTELAHPFSISLNSVSKHIRMLERSGNNGGTAAVVKLTCRRLTLPERDPGKGLAICAQPHPG